ncbi:MAG: hypothetical protein QM705_11095 [Ancrocorticia sp.]
MTARIHVLSRSTRDESLVTSLERLGTVEHHTMTEPDPFLQRMGLPDTDTIVYSSRNILLASQSSPTTLITAVEELHRTSLRDVEQEAPDQQPPQPIIEPRPIGRRKPQTRPDVAAAIEHVRQERRRLSEEHRSRERILSNES